MTSSKGQGHEVAATFLVGKGSTVYNNDRHSSSGRSGHQGGSGYHRHEWGASAGGSGDGRQSNYRADHHRNDHYRPEYGHHYREHDSHYQRQGDDWGTRKRKSDEHSDRRSHKDPRLDQNRSSTSVHTESSQSKH